MIFIKEFKRAHFKCSPHTLLFIRATKSLNCLKPPSGNYQSSLKLISITIRSATSGKEFRFNRLIIKQYFKTAKRPSTDYFSFSPSIYRQTQSQRFQPMRFSVSSRCGKWICQAISSKSWITELTASLKTV